MIIVLEGLDNSGKTTIAENISSYYKTIGKNSIISKELTTYVGCIIKDTMKNKELSAIVKTFLFAADRQIRLEKAKKDESLNDVVIFDRYLYSAIAYREAEGLDSNWVKEVNKFVPKSDLAFYVDISPEESIRRNTDTKFNICYPKEYLEKVRDSYLRYVNRGELIKIDGMRRIELIGRDIINIIQQRYIINE
jgi:dTMP kinase